MIYINNRLVSITKLDKVKNLSKEEAETMIKRMLTFYGNLQTLSNSYLVNIKILVKNILSFTNSC